MHSSPVSMKRCFRRMSYWSPSSYQRRQLIRRILGRAREVAREIAANAPLAVQAAKRMMRMGLNETFPDHVHHVYLQLLPLFKTQDMQEGIKAFMEKREPKFTGR
jgi:enoyl-CoA hydratase/carnithine racemase